MKALRSIGAFGWGVICAVVAMQVVLPFLQSALHPGQRVALEHGRVAMAKVDASVACSQRHSAMEKRDNRFYGWAKDCYSAPDSDEIRGYFEDGKRVLVEMTVPR
jgi:hypothetical protein